jgi:hypothetical protein
VSRRVAFVVFITSLLLAGQRAAGQTVTVSGAVSDPAGGGVPGVSVSAWITGVASASATTGTDGSYQLVLGVGTIHMHLRAPEELRLAERVLDLGWHDSSFTHDVTLEAGSLLTGTVLGPDGAPLHAPSGVGFHRLIAPYPETEWLGATAAAGSGAFSLVVPRDVLWLNAINVDPLHSPRVPVDTRNGDVTGATLTLSSQPIPPYGYPPPVAELITISEIDGLGEAAVTGAAGAVLPLSRVLLVNLCSSHQATAIADAEGGFSAAIFAPPGSALLVKHGPADGRWAELALGMTVGATAFPGTIITLAPEQGSPHFADAGADHVVVDDDPSTVNSVGLGWWIEGEVVVDGPSIPPGGSFEVSGRMRVASPALDAASQAAGLSAGGFMTLAPVFDDEGWPLASENSYLSTVLTPTGFPIQSTWKPRIVIGHTLDFGSFQAIDEHLAEADFSGTVQLPEDLPPGTYRPIVELGVQGSPESSSWIAAHLFGTTFFPGEAGLTPIVVGNAPVAPGARRVIWRLLYDDPMLGLRGLGAHEDGGHFEVATQIVSQGTAYVAPPFDLATGAPIRYRLEPHLPMMTFTDRRFPPRPWLPLKLPGGELRVTVAAPDGTRTELGPAPFVQATVQTATTGAGWDLNPGTSQCNDVYSLSTGDPSFEFQFEQYGPHLITMVGEVEDVWGNRYSGGGSYEIWIAHPLDLAPGVLPGTPLAVGDAVNPTVNIHPPLPAAVEMIVTSFPDSDPAQASSGMVAGHANRFGVFAADAEAPTLARPGELRVDLFAHWLSPDGALFMGAQSWGGVVMTPASEAELAAHGRRGLDCLDYLPPAWFLADEDLVVPEGIVCHAFNPYYAGDVLWSRLGEDTFGGEALLIVGTIHDASGTHLETIRERYERMANLATDPEMQARFAAGELPLFTSTSSGRPPLLFPGEIDQIAYAYRSSQRPGVRVRELVSDDSFDGGYWRLDTLYDDQPGVGLSGDLPDDFKLQYVGAVFRDLDSGFSQYLGQGTGWVYMREDDPGSTRVMPPFAGPGNGGWTTAGGPLLIVDGEDAHLFIVPTGTQPGAILEVGQRFRFAGHMMPPLPSEAEVTVTAPDGRSWSFSSLANSVGYLYDPANDLIVDEPGVWTAEVRLWHDGACSGGSTIPPYPSGSILGAADGRFEFYVAPLETPELTITTPAPGQLPIHGRIPPVVVRGRVPACATVHATITVPGFILHQGAVPDSDGEFELIYDPSYVNQRRSNLDLMGRDDYGPGLSDTVLITLFAEGSSDEGPWYRTGTVSIQGELVAVGSRVLPEAPRRPAGRLVP